MKRKEIEQKAKEIADKYVALGFNSKYNRERYEAAMEMAEWILGEISDCATKLRKEGGEKK